MVTGEVAIVAGIIKIIDYSSRNRLVRVFGVDTDRRFNIIGSGGLIHLYNWEPGLRCHLQTNEDNTNEKCDFSGHGVKNFPKVRNNILIRSCYVK